MEISYKMRKQVFIILLFSTAIISLGAGVLMAQDNPASDCSAESLASRQAEITAQFEIDFSDKPEEALANSYRLGATYQELALQCNYEPTEEEINALVNQVLQLVDIETLIEANAALEVEEPVSQQDMPAAIGMDVDAIMVALEGITGDPIRGEALYTTEEHSGLGSPLGCSNCHKGGVAPATEGTYDRIINERLTMERFADYTAEHYIVESIVTPAAFKVSGFPYPMPTHFGDVLTLQDIADLIAFLETQTEDGTGD